MYKVLAIAREDLAAGFALAGIDVKKAADASGALDVVQGAVESGEYGIVIIDDSLVSEFDERTKAAVFERNVPLVVPVSGEMIWRDVEDIPRDDYVARLIRRAVGYQLDIRL